MTAIDKICWGINFLQFPMGTCIFYFMIIVADERNVGDKMGLSV